MTWARISGVEAECEVRWHPVGPDGRRCGTRLGERVSDEAPEGGHAQIALPMDPPRLVHSARRAMTVAMSACGTEACVATWDPITENAPCDQWFS